MDNNNCFVVRDKIGQALAFQGKRAAANAAADDKLSVIRYPDRSMRSEISTDLGFAAPKGGQKMRLSLLINASVALLLTSGAIVLSDEIPNFDLRPVCRGIAEMASDPGEEVVQI